MYVMEQSILVEEHACCEECYFLAGIAQKEERE
ncbi:MAG: hypothetical protein K0Q73_8873 [Paenibacillus sp.]|jgi:hypothetical protein|nr:hypothetical protein [Paenibacillus sp.]